MKLDCIRNGDCIEELAKLPAGSVDLAFADPPFNIGYDYDVYDDERDSNDYLDWSRKWIAGVARALKPNGTFWLAIGDEYAAELKVLCTRELGLHCRSWVIWFYTFGVHCTTKFTRSHAHLFHFVKDPKNFTFNSLAVRVPSARELVYGDKRADPDGRMPDDTWMMAPVLPPDVPTKDGFILRPQDIPERFPADSDMWYFSRVAGTFGERRGWHGCQMPEQLLGRIIRACSNEGDVVLDPFGGSGTTPTVAKKLSRRYIAFELSPEYAAKIEERLAATKAGEPLVGPENPVLSAPKTKHGRRLKRVDEEPVPVGSKNPVRTKTNLPLEQVAVGNGEFAPAIAEAFTSTHEGYSADRVLADPAFNSRFLEHCGLLGIRGGPKDWNHLLLNVRKSGGLEAIDTSRRTVIKRAAMDAFLFASELAWKRLSEINGCSLDDILCDPDLAAEFDLICKRLSPGFTSLEYRWGALALRKDVARKPDFAKALRPSFLESTPVKVARATRLASSPSQFLLSAPKDEIYIFTGFAEDCSNACILQPKYLERALEFLEFDSCSPRDVLVRVRAKSSTEGYKQVRAEVLRACKPIGNIIYAASAMRSSHLS